MNRRQKAAAIAVFFLTGLGISDGHAATDRSALYPPAQEMWGENVVVGQPSVLFYEGGRLYNAKDRSHWDEIAWEGDWLVYRATEAVAPLTPTRIEFADGIRYLPRLGDREWHGSTRFTSEAGDGLSVYAGSVRGGYLRIDELLLWDSGWVTTWDESYVFGNGQLRHAWGGNATGADRWDITF